MPYNGAGIFARIHNWIADRNAGIKIMAARMDEEMDDYAVAFSTAYLRNGIVPMQGNLNMGNNSILGVANGTVAAPAIRFSNDNSSGPYLIGFNDVGMSVAGILRQEWTTTGTSIKGNADITGNLSVAGTTTFTGAPSFTGPLKLADGTAPIPALQFTSDPDTGIFHPAIADNIAIATGGVSRFNISTTAINAALPILMPDGSAPAPSLTFAAADTDTGIYRAAADTIGFATGGILRCNISTVAATFTLPVRAPDGAQGNVGIGFASAVNYGLVLNGTTIQIMTGAAVMMITSTTVTLSAGTSLNMSGGIAISGANNGIIVNNGPITIAGANAAFGCAGNVSITGTGTLTVAGLATFNGGATFPSITPVTFNSGAGWPKIGTSEIGLRDIPAGGGNGAITFALSDRGVQRVISGGSQATNIMTVPPQSSVAWPVGSKLRVVTFPSACTLRCGAGVSFIFAGAANAVDRLVAANGWAELTQCQADVWVISGSGVT